MLKKYVLPSRPKNFPQPPKGMDQRVMGKILADTLINRLVEPAEVAAVIGELYRKVSCRPWPQWPAGIHRAYRKVYPPST